MKTIYLIRHAESIGQHPDGSLTELGKKEAQDMVARLRDLIPTALIIDLYPLSFGD